MVLSYEEEDFDLKCGECGEYFGGDLESFLEHLEVEHGWNIFK